MDGRDNARHPDWRECPDVVAARPVCCASVGSITRGGNIETRECAWRPAATQAGAGRCVGEQARSRTRYGGNAEAADGAAVTDAPTHTRASVEGRRPGKTPGNAD